MVRILTIYKFDRYHLQYSPPHGKLAIRCLHICQVFLVAPLGGFFASGLKQVFTIKDFGDSIPEHGGMTDRIDCQFIMVPDTLFFYSSDSSVTGTTSVSLQ
jgi:CDP-diglyceride synthetase